MNLFRIGILGAGHIAEKMAATLNGMPEAEAFAVASRSREKAEAFAAQWGIGKAYGSYEEMADDPSVDLIYVATPHSFHHAHVTMCLEKGKPVLCEKAFMLNRAEAESVISLSKSKGVFLAEAIWTRYMPSRQILDRIISEEEIGRPQIMTAHLGYPVSHKERIIRPELGGGALLDLGVYCINLALMTFGNGFDNIASSCIKSETGMDLQETITLKWKDGRMAALMASAVCCNERQAVVCGDKGYVILDNINNPLKFDIYEGRGNYIRTICAPEQITGFEYEVRACIKAVGEGRIEPEEMPHSEIIRVMSIMDGLREEWGVAFPGEKH